MTSCSRLDGCEFPPSVEPELAAVMPAITAASVMIQRCEPDSAARDAGRWQPGDGAQQSRLMADGEEASTEPVTIVESRVILFANSNVAAPRSRIRHIGTSARRHSANDVNMLSRCACGATAVPLLLQPHQHVLEHCRHAVAEVTDGR